MSDQTWIPKDREWSEYPIGTLAKFTNQILVKKAEGWRVDFTDHSPVENPDDACVFLGLVMLPEEPGPIRDVILTTIGDLVADFVYYDRKEDEELSESQLDGAIADGTITIDEMVEKFRECLENTYNSESDE